MSTAAASSPTAAPAGNDQVRFEVGFASLAPDLDVLAPVRDYAWTREKAIAFAEENAIPINVSKRSPFSIDQNVWGGRWKPASWNTLECTHQGRLRLHRRPDAELEHPDEVIVGFEAGVPVSIDGNRVTVLEAIVELNRRAGAQGSAAWTSWKTGWSASRAADL